jgi:1-acyl-sn-glycerol-3-phosphate acyltransferase
MSARGNRTSITARLAQASLRAMGGWRLESEIPEPRKAVILAVPHTHNMDGVLLVTLAQSIGMSISWMVKDVLGKPPIGYVVRGVGGVPVDRSKANGMVGQMIAEFERRDDFYLVIPPEGTRSYTEYWKSGFYRIAMGAGVPVVPGFLDYARKIGFFADPITLTGDVEADMDVLREVYKDARGMAKSPDKFGPIRLREEDPDSAKA